MSVLRFLLNGPLRRRIRLLQAKLELLTSRIEQLEQAFAAASFPDAGTVERMTAIAGQCVTVETREHSLHGILVNLHRDSLELMDEQGQHVVVPAARILLIRQ
ncbi:hypothetical protein [Paenibacillus sanguinis]|uniref:hypothetical protein n=1 Tax=Paenibacillus sanguinis TaxID=225906 RepID=UPI00036FCEC8|nr:hypothetical protein [Paenibacillus sanguinis]